MLLRLMVLFEAHLKKVRKAVNERPDAGYSTETVVMVAILVAIAIAVGAILMSKLLAKANSLDLG
ncbi:hypothetical protein AB0B45_15425 [Nonomuraea sp. NPDC049152]|uniref:hypothetical protein n=1 Tax=Nonomuraea sp. NPDC049152 TaxID=3154350 RepID=UPI0033EF0135